MKIRKCVFFGVKTEITERGLSEEKLIYAVTLNLKVREFSGADSQLDIFSFKKELVKLAEPVTDLLVQHPKVETPY